MKILFFLLFFVSLSLFAMETNSFKKLNKQIKEAGFASEQITLIKTAASTNTFTCEQIKSLLENMSFANDQIEALKTVSKRVEDPENTDILLELFTFDSDKKKVTEIISNITEAKPLTQQNQIPLIVNHTAIWTKADFNNLIDKLKDASFSKDKLNIIKDITKSSNGLNSKQIFSLLETFGFGNDMLKAISMLDHHILELYSSQVSDILKAFSFSGEKLEALKVLKNMIVDAENKFVILDQFTFGSDKEKARKILESVKPRSFIYGSIYTKHVVFVVDISGSMAATFTTNQKEQLTRLNFVIRELKKVISEQLDEETEFNIIVFSDGIRQWQSSPVPANSKNVQNAIEYLSKLKANGGTNIYDSLEKAFSNSKVDSIYFLTDGQPTAGVRKDEAGIIEALIKWNSKTNIPVHTTAFLMGSFSGDNKQAAKKLMSAIAEATKGIFRSIE
ncbi:DUF4476 domain-containing protein [bacterium]|nr:DUF4476 domain-containing protein [bacterium]